MNVAGNYTGGLAWLVLAVMFKYEDRGERAVAGHGAVNCHLTGRAFAVPSRAPLPLIQISEDCLHWQTFPISIRNNRVERSRSRARHRRGFPSRENRERYGGDRRTGGI